jgi:serine protease Do
MRLGVLLLSSCGLFAQGLDLRAFDQALINLSERIGPAVVQVLSDAFSPLSDAPGSPAAYEQSTGSGILLSADGFIITNSHVIKGATKIQVVLPNLDAIQSRSSIVKPRGRRLTARLVGVDRETDLAVLKIDGEGLPFLALGDSDLVKQGQLVLAFGSPFGLQNSMAMGIVSAVARQLEADDPMIYIQSDVSINPGNSGGPMVDVQGNVVGVNTMIISESGGSEGVGLAVPSNIVRTVFEQIVKNGVVRRGEIGIEAQTITETMAESLKLPRTSGVILGDVTPNGPAAKSGLRTGDIILTMNGKPMENARQLQVNLYSKPVDSFVEIEAQRGKQILKRQVRVTERPNDPDRFAALVNQAVASVPQLGIMGLEIDTKVREMLPETRRSRGILVANVLAAAARPSGALETGDIIYAVNLSAIATLDEIKAALANFRTGDLIVLQVEREGRLRYVEVTLD